MSHSLFLFPFFFVPSHKSLSIVSICISRVASISLSSLQLVILISTFRLVSVLNSNIYSRFITSFKHRLSIMADTLKINFWVHCPKISSKTSNVKVFCSSLVSQISKSNLNVLPFNWLLPPGSLYCPIFKLPTYPILF